MLMERNGGFLLLLLLLLGLSFLLSAAAVPSSRSLKSITEHLLTQDLFQQGGDDDALRFDGDDEELSQELKGRELPVETYRLRWTWI